MMVYKEFFLQRFTNVFDKNSTNTFGGAIEII